MKENLSNENSSNEIKSSKLSTISSEQHEAQKKQPISLPFNVNDLLNARLQPTKARKVQVMSTTRSCSNKINNPTFSTTVGKVMNSFNLKDIQNVKLKPVLRVPLTQHHTSSNAAAAANNNNGTVNSLQESLRIALNSRFAKAMPSTPFTVPSTPGYDDEWA